MTPTFDGLMCNLATLPLLSPAQTRSICSENRSGAKSGGARELPPTDDQGRPIGPARTLGQGWKVHAHDPIRVGETFVLADIEGPGCIQHIWMTPTGDARTTILRIYYDGSEQPAVECPVADFFASAFTSFKVFAPLRSLAVCVNPGSAFNCYWPMPFRKRIRLTLHNIHPKEEKRIFYQIDYALNAVPADAAYFHAQFRRTNPLKAGDVYTILDGVKGAGHYAGTYLAWQVNNNGWWGEGEIKFYLDGDADPALSDGKVVAGSTGFPTICGTGTEDYFCASYGFPQQYSTAYVGCTLMRGGQAGERVQHRQKHRCDNGPEPASGHTGVVRRSLRPPQSVNCAPHERIPHHCYPREPAGTRPSPSRQGRTGKCNSRPRRHTAGHDHPR